MEDNNIEYVLPVERDDLKKKTKCPLTYIILSVVVVVALIVAALTFLLPKSIQGEWELVVNPEISQATPDEIEDSKRVYYTFSKPNKYGDGTYKTFFDGGVEEGTYKLSEKDGKELINLGTKDMEYKIKGSKLLGLAKLTIIYPEYTNEETGEKIPAENYVFEQAKAPNYEKECYDSYETDSKLIGRFTSNERTLAYYMYELPYTQTVELFGNGIMTIHYESQELMLNRCMYYAYTAQNNELTFSLVTDKEKKYTVKYEIDENGNLVFTEDSTNGSIFADAFFSTVTYYTADNLPKETLADTSATEQ